MKSPTLPATELANNWNRPEDSQYSALYRFASPAPGKRQSYNLVKQILPEAIGAQLPMFEAVTPGLTGSALWTYGNNLAKGNLEKLIFNWPVIACLAEWSNGQRILARQRDMDTVPLIGTHRAKLVGNAVALINGRPSLLTLDPRRSNALTTQGIFVLQSLIKNLMCDQDPTLADFDISVLQFQQTSAALQSPVDCSVPMRRRHLAIHQLAERQAISWGDLKAGIAQTLRIYQQVLEDQRRNRVKTASGPDLFG